MLLVGSSDYVRIMFVNLDSLLSNVGMCKTWNSDFHVLHSRMCNPRSGVGIGRLHSQNSSGTGGLWRVK